jgi:class 3 adenylate cyclase
MNTPRDQPEKADRAYLKRLMAERYQHPERVAEIDRKVNEVFGRKAAILVLDMCGFSRLTARHGIIHFLALIHQMEEAACPAVTGNGGQVIKQEADNLFAIFARPAQALEAALDIFRAFEAMNAVVKEDHAIHGSIGIGFGDTLIIGDEDLFGQEMNLACKLGEDLACKQEILLTPAAHDALPPDRYVCIPAAYSISGLELLCHRFERCLHPQPPGTKRKDGP